MNLEQILQNVESQLDIATGNIKWDDDETLAQINLANTHYSNMGQFECSQE